MTGNDDLIADRADDDPDAVAPSVQRPRISAPVGIAGVGSVLLAAVGLLFSRPDLAAVGAPLALWAVLALTARWRTSDDAVKVRPADSPGSDTLADRLDITSDAEIVELVVIQAERLRRTVLVPGRSDMLVWTRALHSGPLRTLIIEGRTVGVDGGAVGAALPSAQVTRTVPPASIPVAELPYAWRLTGLHGGHEGSRPGQGGDFRDIHPFAPGDELRRVDWRATARAARRRGDLLVRRTNALSDSSAVIAMDTADDLGSVVATWGKGEPTRSGTTSLDLARGAARAIAEGTVAAGDRISFHTLAHGGRTVRSGSGPRHLARVVAEIAASGQRGDDSRFRRTPPIPHGSVVWVLSTFFDGAAAEIAIAWRASGHRVVAVDVLPELDQTRLPEDRRLALQVLLTERRDMLDDLTAAGIDIIVWRDDPAARLAALTRTRPGMPAGARR